MQGLSGQHSRDGLSQALFDLKSLTAWSLAQLALQAAGKQTA